MGSKKLDEAFRVIRTNLHFLNEKENSRVILITSSIPKEGKSVVASNYAMSLAKIGEKVLIIDCNLKKPKIDEKFGLFFEKGLESVLAGEYKVEDLILKNVEKNLDVLPIKKITDDITSFFLKKNLKTILDEVIEKYDAIILDTPSLIVSSDAAILSKYSDGVIYVIGYNQVTQEELEFGKKILNNAKANIYGFIVNKIDKNGVLYGGYRYYNKDYYNKKIKVLEKIFRIFK
ncbi:CpsD/CapB family tyrosine-protein kinase [Cetobacterium somerae]|uniref:CpsD/CapB family tyrosine-protein kinase n=1 Tax=Cetobacterium somerae TaxID=188913 RepID=UPI00248EB0A8|nr:CpsD/CapB family tyrosine-protein kinase [Cetobacterium somerae]